MARIFPSKLSGRVPRHVAAVFRQFKKLPDDFQVWFSLEGDRDRPDCFLLWQERFGFLVHVADIDQPRAESALQASLFESDRSLTVAELGREESAVLESFSEGLREELGEAFPLRKLVVFPRVNNQTIEAISLQRAESGVRFLGLKQFNTASLPEFLAGIADAALPGPKLVQLRRSFSPETSIPASFSPLAIGERNAAAALTDGLLDMDQEWCMKNDLHLPGEAEKVAGEPGSERQRNLLVTGVAGSGKSLVLLYRALLNARLDSSARVLLLTHNRPLNFELQRRAALLDDVPPNLECLTFFQWARQQLAAAGRWVWGKGGIINPPETRRLLGKLLHASGANFTPSFLVDEIAWIKDHNLRHKADYLQIERSGRGTALQISRREEVWGFYRSYQKDLEASGRIDWHGVAMRFHDAALGGDLPFPRYDCVLIDEAQFFAKSWFDIVNASLTERGHLFLAADPTQGFLRRRQSWLASGIDVRGGRTTRLKQAYRNSRRILQFAAGFFESRTPPEDAGDAEGLNVPDASQIAAIPVEGSPPQIVYCGSAQDVQRRAANEVTALREEGLPPGKVLLLVADGAGEALAAAIGRTCRVHDAKAGQLPGDAFCQVSTLNAATGMEAPIVFVLGIEHLVEKEGAPTLSEDERREVRRDNTRQLYMAFTRAGQRLVVITSSRAMADHLQAIVDRCSAGQTSSK